jgi:hypothetical protein
MHAQDTSELFFTDVRVPAANLLGAAGGGFVALMRNLPRERVTIGVTALAMAEQALGDDPAQRSFHDEGMSSVEIFDLVRRVIATATPPLAAHSRRA